MENIRIGESEEMKMPPEPPQKRADELEGYVDTRAKRKTKSGFKDLEQPKPNKEVKKEEEVKKVTPAEAQAEAMKPRIDRPSVLREGKIARRTPKGAARPL
jgi:hypothetical protein